MSMTFFIYSLTFDSNSIQILLYLNFFNDILNSRHHQVIASELHQFQRVIHRCETAIQMVNQLLLEALQHQSLHVQWIVRYLI